MHYLRGISLPLPIYLLGLSADPISFILNEIDTQKVKIGKLNSALNAAVDPFW